MEYIKQDETPQTECDPCSKRRQKERIQKKHREREGGKNNTNKTSYMIRVKGHGALVALDSCLNLLEAANDGMAGCNLRLVAVDESLGRDEGGPWSLSLLARRLFCEPSALLLLL